MPFEKEMIRPNGKDFIKDYTSEDGNTKYHAEFHYNLGSAFHELKFLDKGEAAYKKAIALDSKYIEAFNNLGTVYNDMGRLHDAKFCFEKTIELDSEYSKAYSNLGNTLKRLHKYKEAEACCEKSIKINKQLRNP